MPDVYGSGPVADDMPRCWRCNRLLAEMLTRPWRIRCYRCKAANQRGATAPLPDTNPVQSVVEASCAESPAPSD